MWNFQLSFIFSFSFNAGIKHSTDPSKDQLGWSHGLQVQGPEFKPQYQNKQKGFSQALAAHACNSSYSGGRDRENRSSKPT
jgi:hypothetical protein